MLLLGAGAAVFALLSESAPGADQYFIPTPPRHQIDKTVPTPVDNPLTVAKAKLGKYLFFDLRLSRDQSVSCSSCHRPHRGYTDAVATPTGVGGTGRRNAPSLLNVVYRTPLFWDGRVGSLEEQVEAVITSPREMDNTPETVVERLRASHLYRSFFRDAFGSEEITMERIAQAIASFERTILSADSTFDRSLDAENPRPLTDAARRGFQLFTGKAQCSLCHSGPIFSDNGFYNLGVGWDRPDRDLGRYEDTALEEDRGRFKTPTLRDLVHTAPYMHDGSMESLEEVIDFFDRGGGPNPYLDPRMKPLNLTQREKADLAAFLRSLSGTTWQEPKWPENLIAGSH